MHLVVDSGSTKATWKIIGKPNFEQITNGLNPMVATSSFILLELKSLAENHLIKDLVQEIDFYGAGCGNNEGADKMQSYLAETFPNAKITVQSDLMLAAKSVLGDKSGVVCILGTGSNAAYYDGKTLHPKVPSLGYILGDEGAGVGIGKAVLKAYLNGDKEWFALLKTEELETDKQKIIAAIYHLERPNTYMAKFAQTALHHLNHKKASDLVKLQLNCFFNEMVTPNLVKDYPLGFVGSVAFLAKDLILQICEKRGLKVRNFIQYPINGIMDYLENKQ